jgi:hypothetical protein
MKLPNLEDDFWELISAEIQHERYPNTFWIPTLEERQKVECGQSVKLLFNIQLEDDDGKISHQVERMWLIVSEKIGEYYIGILDNQPASFIASDDDYLCFGAEIPFLAEHIADIGDSPKEYSEWQLNLPPEHIWPRED